MKKILLMIGILGSFMVSACSGNKNNTANDTGIAAAKTQTSISILKLITETPISNEIIAVTPGSSVLPTMTTTPTFSSYCDDKSELIEETLPDMTVVKPGVPFQKQWVLQNTGSCTWTGDYGLIFVGGNQLSGKSPTLINQIVPPNETVEITLDLISPMQPGYYESFWKIQNNQGTQFGIGFNNDLPLWIKIHSGNKEVLGGGLDLGEPTWWDSFDEDNGYIYQGKNNITSYEIKNGNLEITAINPIGDVWQIAKNHVLFNIFFELIVTTGETCVGKDGYGVLLRAPDQADGVIDSGYIFGFTCDGMYRIYRMDNGEYNSIQEWTASNFIRPGPNQTNRLGINADGNKFQLFANGEFLTEFVDSNYPSGLFGTMVRSETTNNFKINIEEIAYWRIAN